MDNNFYTDDLERLLKEKSDEFRMYPSKRVWHSLYNDLHPSRRWPSVTISMLLVLVLMLTGYLNTNDTETSNRTQLVQYDISVHSNTNSTQPKKDRSQGKIYTTGINEEDQTAATAETNNTNGNQPVLSLLAAEPSITGIAEQLSGNTNAQPSNGELAGAATDNKMSNGFPLLLIRDKNMYNTFALKNLNSANHLTYNWTSFPTEASNTGFPGNTATTPTAFISSPVKGTLANNSRINNYNPAVTGIATNIFTEPSVTSRNLVTTATTTRTNRANNNRVTPAKDPAGNIAKATGTRPRTPNTTATAKANSNKNNTDGGATTAAGSDEAIVAPPEALNTTAIAASAQTTAADPAAPNTAADITATNKKGLSKEDKAWIEDFAFHNKPVRKRWKDQVAMEFYITPGLSYRFASNEIKGQSAAAFANSDINSAASQKPGLGIEAGAGIAYAFAKNLRFKAGLQFNYTNYGINARETSHPILTSLLMNDGNSGLTYSTTRPSSIVNGNNGTGQPVTLHNRTYQVSIPLGLAYKLATYKKIEWYAGASIQPSYVFGGDAYLLTADLKNYVSEPTALRRWNFNTGIETYIHYNLGSISLQAGPQFRYQLQSTYGKQFTTSEKLYNVGLKLGIVKGF